MRFRTTTGGPHLLGRGSHERRLGGLLERARAGHGGALVLAGEPGIGKTALLEGLIDRCAGESVLTTAGVESEASLSFAGLGDLLRPLLPGLSALPQAQARALSAALALTDPPGPVTPYAVCMATLTLLTRHAERQPAVVIIDDAHWVDQPSMTALLFTARRLADDPVLIVLAVRDNAAHELGLDGLDVDRVEGLDRVAAGRLLDRQRPGGVTAAVADELWRATGGNPLALGKVCAGLSGEVLAGAVPLPPELPVGPDLRAAFVAGLRRLPPETRWALLIIALSASEERATIAAALAALGSDPAALDPALAAGVVEYRGTRLVFAHPLVRTSVRVSASTQERRRAYDVLAAASSGDSRAWYRAAELIGYDESAARELELAAARMRQRTGFAGAARALHRSAELTPDRGLRAQRLLAAAGDAQLCGRLPEAAGWLGEAHALTGDPALRAEVALAHGRVLAWLGTSSIALQVITAAATEIAGDDPGRGGRLWCTAVDIALMDGRGQAAVDYATSAVALLNGAGDPAGRSAARTVLGEALLVRGRVAESRRLLDEESGYTRALDPLAAAEEVALVALCRAWLEDFPAAAALLRPVIEATRRAGVLGSLARALCFDAEIRRCTGDWPTGYAAAEEALHLSRETRAVSTVGFALVSLARYDALRGDVAAADARLAEAARIAGPHGTAGLLILAGTAEGQRHLIAGEPDRAVAALEAVRDFVGVSDMESPAMTPWEAELVEAYRQDGRIADARRQLDSLDAKAAAGGLIGAQAAVARHRALLADDPARAEKHFREALRLHELCPQPLEQSRTALGFGEMLRRNRQRAAARPVLREALEVFRRLGAGPLARRAADELAAAGDRRWHGTVSPIGVLTPRELQVAQAITAGLSNPEVAAALFVSTKTVETHLSRAYRKLGLRSRTQLARYLVDNGGLREYPDVEPAGRRHEAI
jgi:DNA-binding CsgD family transcriptional regulator